MNFRKSFRPLFLSAVVVIAATPAFSQELRTAYFMDNAPVANAMNPAMVPHRGYFSIPVIGMTEFSLTSKDFSPKDLFYVNSQDKLSTFMDQEYDLNEFLGKLGKDNAFTTDINLGIINAGWHTPKGFWTIDMGLKTSLGMSIPKNMFEFMRKASTGEGLMTNGNYMFENFNFNLDMHAEVGVGHARPVTDRLTVGMKVKAILGLASIDMKIQKFGATFNLSSMEWSGESKGSIKGSCKGAKFEQNPDGSVKDIEFDTPGVSGFGAGVDFGATYRLMDNLRLAASVTDLGFIAWSKNSALSASADGAFTSDDFTVDADQDAMDQLGDVFSNMVDMMSAKVDDPQATTTMLRTTVNIGAEYTILNNLLGFGVLSSTRFVEPATYTELTAIATVRPKTWFTGSLSYSFIHSKSESFGLVLNFSPCWINFLVGTDYMVFDAKKGVPQMKNAINAHVGLAIPLGRRG